MDPVIAIALWAALFVGSHLLISSKAIRPRIVAAVGQRAYPGVYSIVALATFIGLVLAFAHHKHSGAILWDLREVAPIRWLVWLLMLLAFIIFVASFMTPSPASMGAQGARIDPGAVRGVLKISRHPAFVAFSIFGLAHILMNGFVGDVLFFGSFPALSILGGMAQDQRKEAQLGAAYRGLIERTSFVPGAALLDGRQHWTAADTPWIAVLAGIAITVVIVLLHPMIFGGFPLGIAR